ncbi:MAG: type III pantothenate kinase [Clostridia bacterium]
MLLAIDMGNTNITLGVYKDDKLQLVSRVYTSRKRTSEQYAVEFLQLFRLNSIDPERFSGAILSSVVPELTSSICKAVKLISGVDAICVDSEINGGLKIAIDSPPQLGSDLIAGSIGAKIKYEMPCFVIDLGTATKILILNENGDFCGCTISPGVKISLDALASGTSQLPSISFTMPKSAVGTNTVECMQSGIVFGTAAMLDGLTKRLKNELGYDKVSVVATGGYSKGIVSCCEMDVIYDENLILDGLKAIYDSQAK